MKFIALKAFQNFGKICFTPTIDLKRDLASHIKITSSVYIISTFSK